MVVVTSATVEKNRCTTLLLPECANIQTAPATLGAVRSMARSASGCPTSQTRISKPACYEPGINADRIRNLCL
jgi:hypothetical protein